MSIPSVRSTHGCVACSQRATDVEKSRLFGLTPLAAWRVPDLPGYPHAFHLTRHPIKHHPNAPTYFPEPHAKVLSRNVWAAI